LDAIHHHATFSIFVGKGSSVGKTSGSVGQSQNLPTKMRFIRSNPDRLFLEIIPIYYRLSEKVLNHRYLTTNLYFQAVYVSFHHE